jgi:hypothetical protein
MVSAIVLIFGMLIAIVIKMRGFWKDNWYLGKEGAVSKTNSFILSCRRDAYGMECRDLKVLVVLKFGVCGIGFA